MNRKIFNSIWLAVITVFLASLLFIMNAAYSYFSSVQKKQLRVETELAAAGTSLSGMDYFDALPPNNYRITWIAADGTVLYDNEADSTSMENHLEREEVRAALASGFGEAARHSYTLADQQFYAAKRLPDGSILRLSTVQLSLWSLVLGFGSQIAFVALLALIASYFLAARLAKNIVKPINRIDIDAPEQYYGKEEYKEVEPLLRRIAAQQEQIKRDQDQIEQTALIRQEFTANVSHELKTPLHVISGYAELLENGLVSAEDIKPFAEKIHAESMRMTSLVGDIIDLTKLDNGGTGMTWEDCDLYRIAENAIDSLELAATASIVTVNLKGSSSILYGIPSLLYSIVYNLCDNAVKYNHPGGVVNVSVSQDSAFTTLVVQDTGIGIPPDSRERIFERFYRVDKSRSKEVGGTGLGLSIVKHAVMVHKGTIALESHTGKGTTFTVRIPNRG